MDEIERAKRKYNRIIIVSTLGVMVVYVACVLWGVSMTVKSAMNAVGVPTATEEEFDWGTDEDFGGTEDDIDASFSFDEDEEITDEYNHDAEAQGFLDQEEEFWEEQSSDPDNAIIGGPTGDEDFDWGYGDEDDANFDSSFVEE